MKQGQPKVPTITKFLSDLATMHYQKESKPLKVGMDAYVHSANFAKELSEAFEEAAKDVELDGDEEVNGANGEKMEEDTASTAPPIIAEIDTLDGKPNIIDSIWEGRPALPKNPFRVQV